MFQTATDLMYCAIACTPGTVQGDFARHDTTSSLNYDGFRSRVAKKASSPEPA